MRQLAQFAVAAGVGLAGAGTAAAQTTTAGTTGATTTTATGNTGGNGNGGQSGGNSGFTAPTQQQAAQISGADISVGTVNATNAFGQYYANPLYQGRIGSDGTGAPGGFGSPTYTSGGSTGGGTTRTGGFSGSNTARTGMSGATAGATGAGRTGATASGTTGTRTGAAGGGQTGFGATAGTAGLGQTGRANTGTGQTGRGNTGLGGNQQQSAGIIIPLPTQLNYVTTARFPAPAFNTPAMQADLRGMLDRTSQIANPRGISLEIGEGGLVVLRGTVRDQDERETAEGMVRLTPGVKQVKNELAFK